MIKQKHKILSFTENMLTIKCNTRNANNLKRILKFIQIIQNSDKNL